MVPRWSNPLSPAIASRLLLAVAASGLAGCADGPVPELARLNPWLTKEWEADERFTATYHRRVDDLRTLAIQAGRMSDDDQQRTVADLGDRLAKEPSAPMRVELVRTLAAFRTPNAETPLLNALNDHQSDVRVMACRALGQRQSDAAMTALAEAVGGDADLDVRIAATRELGRFKDPRATQALALALDENDAALQRVAMDSLRGTTGKDYGHSASAWREFLRGGNPAPPPPITIAERLREYQFW
jgi:hypothetical protein